MGLTRISDLAWAKGLWGASVPCFGSSVLYCFSAGTVGPPRALALRSLEIIACSTLNKIDQSW